LSGQDETLRDLDTLQVERFSYGVLRLDWKRGVAERSE